VANFSEKGVNDDWVPEDWNQVLSTEAYGVEAHEHIADKLKYAKACFHHSKPKEAMKKLQSLLQDATDLRAPIVFRKTIQKYMAVLRHIVNLAV
jgi:hypothetical protein